MPDDRQHYSGGCLCGALRYEAKGVPLYAGYCYCGDCRRASGSGFVPFIGVASTAVRFTGNSRRFCSRSARGGEAVRNTCPICASLVFGGRAGQDSSHTIYAGTLDNPAQFRPTIAIFARDRPAWVPMPSGLTVFETMPPDDPLAG